MVQVEMTCADRHNVHTFVHVTYIQGCELKKIAQTSTVWSTRLYRCRVCKQFKHLWLLSTNVNKQTSCTDVECGVAKKL